MTGRRPLKTPAIVKAMFPGEGDVISPAAFAVPQAVRQPAAAAAQAGAPEGGAPAAGGPPGAGGPLFPPSSQAAPAAALCL